MGFGQRFFDSWRRPRKQDAGQKYLIFQRVETRIERNMACRTRGISWIWAEEFSWWWKSLRKPTQVSQKKRQGIVYWRQFACCTLWNWTRSLKIFWHINQKLPPTAAIPLGKWLAPGEVPLLRGQDAAKGIHGLCRTWGFASYGARSGGRGHHNHSRIPEVNIHLGPAVFTVCRDSMHVPCFLCCKHGLGDFFPIQAASRREARKRLDESLSWVGVEWVRVAGWWLIGTQFWLSKQETPQSSPAILLANLVSICSVCQEWLQRRATGNIWRPHHWGSGQASLQLSHH